VQDLKKGIREDPRYTKFSSSEKKCEKEFVAWLKDKTMKARDDYKQLLQVSDSVLRIRDVFPDPGYDFFPSRGSEFFPSRIRIEEIDRENGLI
jgi:hypothetical protein